MQITVSRLKFVLAAITLMFFTVASQASANEIALRLNEVPPGLVTVYERNDGSFFSMLYVGQTPNGYQVEWYAGDMQGSAARTAFLDEEGNTLRYTEPSGKSRTYTPHYCNRTLGTCRLNLVDENGDQRSLTVITRATNDGFRQTQRRRGGADFKTQITLTTFGIRGFERKEDGRTVKLINSYVRN